MSKQTKEQAQAQAQQEFQEALEAFQSSSQQDKDVLVLGILEQVQQQHYTITVLGTLVDTLTSFLVEKEIVTQEEVHAASLDAVEKANQEWTQMYERGQQAWKEDEQKESENEQTNNVEKQED